MHPRTLAIVTSLVLAPLAIASNVIISPNMGMPVPIVGTAPGPEWANDINASLSIIDSHDHTVGHGVQVPPAGLNINSDLTFQSNNATNLRSTRYTAQSAPLSGGSDLGAVYVSGVDLYYNDENGNQVRITQSGSVTGSTGTITGLPSGTASASYAASTFTFQSATSTPAKMAVGPVSIGTNTASSKTVTLAPPGGLAANYNLTLPNGLPVSTSVLTVDSSGNMASTTTPTISPTISSATLTGALTSSGGSLVGSFAGTPTFSGAPTFSAGASFNGGVGFTSNANINGGGQLNGTFSGNPTLSGNPTFGGNPTFNGTPLFASAITFNGTPSFNGGADFLTGPVTISTTGGNVPHACTSRSHSCSSVNTCTSTCSGGEIVTGGGCSMLAGYRDSIPGSSTSWLCNSQTTTSIDAYAICCSI